MVAKEMAALLTAPSQKDIDYVVANTPMLSALDAARRKKLTTGSDPTEERVKLDQVANLSPSLAAILRPQAAYRWLLPYVASITPTYVESVLRGALAGNHVQAWELFDLMCDSDPEINSCVNEYIEGVLSHKLVYEAWHEEEKEPSDLALEKQKLVSSALRGMRPDPASDENSMNGTLRDLLFARFFGQSVLEIDWHDTYGTGQLNMKRVAGLDGPVLCPRSTFWVHPVCYAWGVEGRLGLRAATGYRNPKQIANGNQDITALVEPPAWSWITSQPRPSNLQDFPKNKFLISVFKSKAGTALGGSCLRPLAWWWVASNFCGDWLLNYAQLFGIPFRKAKYEPSTSAEQKQEILQMLQSCGSAGYMMLPASAEVEFMEGGGNAGQSPQAFLFHFADSQKRKVILHQTMTGGQHDSMGKGGGKAFGEVEDDTKSQCIAAGARFAAEQINLQLIPMILELNYGKDGDQEAPECKLVDSEVGGLVDAQTMQVVSTMVDVPASHLRRMFAIPKAGPEDEIAGVEQGTAGAQAKAAADQFQQTQKAQADQADANREHAQALAKTAAVAAPKPGAAGAGPAKPGQQQAQPDDNAEMDARRSIPVQAAAAGEGKGCLMAMLPAEDAARLTEWSKSNIQADTLTGDGIEHESHVTVYYGFNLGFDTAKLAALLKRRKPVDLTVGNISRFECPDYDVIKCDIDSPALENLHKLIDGRLKDDLTPSEHAYHPHLTLAYVTKGSNKDLDGTGPFEGGQFTISSLLFSEPEHTNRKTVQLQARHTAVHYEGDPHQETVAALHDTVKPLLDRIDSIGKIEHKATRIKMMRKLLKDAPHLAAAMMHDDSLARAVAPAFVRKFAEKLAEEKGKTP